MGIQRDLTKGNLVYTLLMFALPYVAANFMQALYGAVDLIIVGKFCDSSVISAVATGAQLLQTLTFFITGLTVSTTILIGKAFGAKEYDNIIKIINTMTVCFIGAAILLSTLVIIFKTQLLNILQTPAEAYKSTDDYVFICSLGLISIFAYNAVSAVLRGLGNSVAPMFFVAISCTINIILDIILVGKYEMGAQGAAIATVIAQTFSVIIGITYLKKGDFVFKFKFRNIKFDIQTAKEIFKIGLPLSLQDTLVPLSFLFLFSLANSMGVAASAAYGSVIRLNAFMMLPAGSFSMALTALTAQNLGAGNITRAINALKLSIAFAFSFGLIFFLWQQLAPKSAIAIFSTEKEVLDAGALYLKSFSFDYILVPFVFCFNGFFFGCGRTAFAAANSIFSAFAIRIPVAFILCSVISGATLFELGIAAPSSSIFTGTVALVYLVYLSKKGILVPDTKLQK
ncbi:MAG: MATE family efflux transporter [Candidatus Gastranaerophilales bacterium]|nr:MATE family efflux transporter [Candidatus Gastranaerophilales bacterium]